LPTNSELGGASFVQESFQIYGNNWGGANHSPHTFPLIFRKGSSILPSINKKIQLAVLQESAVLKLRRQPKVAEAMILHKNKLIGQPFRCW